MHHPSSCTALCKLMVGTSCTMFTKCLLVLLDVTFQFENHVNPRIHYDTTGIEILDALGDIDMFVAGAGTGGTLTGAGYRIKERFPSCVVIAAEPEGSTMFNEHGRKHPFLVTFVFGNNLYKPLLFLLLLIRVILKILFCWNTSFKQYVLTHDCCFNDKISTYHHIKIKLV